MYVQLPNASCVVVSSSPVSPNCCVRFWSALLAAVCESVMSWLEGTIADRPSAAVLAAVPRPLLDVPTLLAAEVAAVASVAVAVAAAVVAGT